MKTVAHTASPNVVAAVFKTLLAKSFHVMFRMFISILL